MADKTVKVDAACPASKGTPSVWFRCGCCRGQYDLDCAIHIQREWRERRSNVSPGEGIYGAAAADDSRAPVVIEFMELRLEQLAEGEISVERMRATVLGLRSIEVVVENGRVFFRFRGGCTSCYTSWAVVRPYASAEAPRQSMEEEEEEEEGEGKEAVAGGAGEPGFEAADADSPLKATILRATGPGIKYATARTTASLVRRLKQSERRPTVVTEQVNLGQTTRPTLPDGVPKTVNNVLEVHTYYPLAEEEEVWPSRKALLTGPNDGTFVGFFKKPQFPKDWIDPALDTVVWSLDRSPSGTEHLKNGGMGDGSSRALSMLQWDALPRKKGDAAANGILHSARRVTPLRGSYVQTGEKTHRADGAPSYENVTKRASARTSSLMKHRPGGAFAAAEGLLEEAVAKVVDPLCAGACPRSRIGVHPICTERQSDGRVLAIDAAYFKVEAYGVAEHRSEANAVPVFGFKVPGGKMLHDLKPVAHSAELGGGAESSGASGGGAELVGGPEGGGASGGGASGGGASSSSSTTNHSEGGTANTAPKRAQKHARERNLKDDAAGVEYLRCMTASRDASADVLLLLAQKAPHLATSCDAAAATKVRTRQLTLARLSSASPGAAAPKQSSRRRVRRLELKEPVLAKWGPGDEAWWEGDVINIREQSSGRVDVQWGDSMPAHSVPTSSVVRIADIGSLSARYTEAELVVLRDKGLEEPEVGRLLHLRQEELLAVGEEVPELSGLGAEAAADHARMTQEVRQLEALHKGDATLTSSVLDADVSGCEVTIGIEAVGAHRDTFAGGRKDPDILEDAMEFKFGEATPGISLKELEGYDTETGAYEGEPVAGGLTTPRFGQISICGQAGNVRILNTDEEVHAGVATRPWVDRQLGKLPPSRVVGPHGQTVAQLLEDRQKSRQTRVDRHRHSGHSEPVEGERPRKKQRGQGSGQHPHWQRQDVANPRGCWDLATGIFYEDGFAVIDWKAERQAALNAGANAAAAHAAGSIQAAAAAAIAAYHAVQFHAGPAHMVAAAVAAGATAAQAIGIVGQINAIGPALHAIVAAMGPQPGAGGGAAGRPRRVYQGG